VLASGTALLVEERIPIDCELAALVARRPDGEAVVYPVVETVQREGICHEVIAPAPIPPEITAEFRRLALAVAEAVKLTGVRALELCLANGALTINEIASRPHNSGHYTIEGCVTSQVENHLRAVLDLPLGVTDLLAPAVATVNVLAGSQTGNLAANLPAALAVPGARMHLYGKAARAGRKVGRVTALGAEMNEARGRALKAASLLSGSTSTEVPV
jgi:5-(carboxyamino)imidazole ribonucleotide synthase